MIGRLYGLSVINPTQLSAVQTLVEILSGATDVTLVERIYITFGFAKPQVFLNRRYPRGRDLIFQAADHGDDAGCKPAAATRRAGITVWRQERAAALLARSTAQ